MTEELINSVHMLYLENYIAKKALIWEICKWTCCKKKTPEKRKCFSCSMYSHMCL